MRILITGAAGQLGRELTERFSKQGKHEVIATTRETLDLSKRDSVLGVITTNQPDIIVHSGAFTAVDKCETELDLAFGINALGTRHVVDGAERVGATVVYVSTDYVFDGAKESPYNEWDIPNPQSVYGLSKLGGEREMRTQDTIVRTSWVFGRYGHNMVKTVLKLADSTTEMAFVDDQHGKPTCAQDLAACIYYLATARLPGTFHVTNGGETTWYEFVREILQSAGKSPDQVRPIKTSDLDPPRPARRPENSVLDNAALRLQSLPELTDHRVALKRVLKELLT